MINTRLNNSIRLSHYLLVITVLFVVGCTPAKPKVPRETLHIVAQDTINPDLRGRPSPVVLSIYSLAGDSIFNNARFIELYNNKKDVLGMDFLGVKEIEILPGQTLDLPERDLHEKATFVGVIAAFRDIDNAQWRGIVAVQPGESFDLNINVEHLTITVSKD